MRAKYFCENCGTLVDASVKSCPSCGFYFNAVRCPSCGFLGSQLDFKKGCPACGFLQPRVETPIKERKAEKYLVTASGSNQKGKTQTRSLPFRFYLILLVLLLAVLGILVRVYLYLE